MPSSIPDPPCIRPYSFHRGLPKRTQRDDQPAALGLAIWLLAVPGGLMDEEAGQGGCHSG